MADLERLIASIANDIRYELSDARMFDVLHNARSIEQVLRDALTPAIATARAEGRQALANAFKACTHDDAWQDGHVDWCADCGARRYFDGDLWSEWTLPSLVEASNA